MYYKLKSKKGLLGMYMYLKQKKMFYLFFLLENYILRYYNYKNQIFSCVSTMLK